MALFKLSDEVYPQLVRLVYANFEKVEPKRRGRTHYTTKVKDTIITLTTASIERISNLNPNPLKLPPLMSTSKARKPCLNKYAHASKIKESNQSNTALHSDLGIFYFILVRTI